MDLERQADEAQENPTGPGDSLLRAIIKGTSDAVFAKDFNGRYVWVNPRHARFLGRPAGEIVGNSDADLFPPAFAAQLTRSDAQVLTTQEPMTYEIISSATGDMQVFLTTKSVYFDDKGDVVGLIGISRDITEERRREREVEALAKGRSALVQLGNAALDGAGIPALWDMTARFVQEHLGVEYSKVLALQPDGRLLMVAGAGWEEGAVGNAVDDAETGSQAGYTLQQGGPVMSEDIRAETRFRVPPLLVKHSVVSTVSIAVDTDTGPFGVLEADSTRPRRFNEAELDLLRIAAHLLGSAIGRARVEQGLAEEQERLRVVMESTTAGIVVVDAPTREIVTMNAAAARLFGLRHGQRHTLDAFEVAPERRRPDGTRYPQGELPIERALRGETVNAEQVHLRTPDGGHTPVLMNAAPLYGPAGILGAVEVVQDVSALEEAERLKRDFHAMIAHDIRSPVASIKSAVEMAREDIQAGALGEVTDSLDAIDRLTDRLVQLARDILDTAQLEAGAFSVETQPAALRPVLDEALPMQSAAGGARMEVVVPPDLPDVLMDRGRILQVMLNLLNNAAKFAEPGSDVRVDAEDAGGEVIVRVRNRGQRVPDDKVSLLFKKYSRVHPGTRDREGSGLGLAIAKGIVEAHGGRIWMERAEERRETVFAFTLPLAGEGRA